MPTKTALITGCSSGIGKELTLQLANAGWQVFAGARRPESLRQLSLGNVVPVQLDVNDSAQIEQALELIEHSAGQLDLLVNNAGYGAMGPLVEMPLDEVRRQFETNVFAPLALTQAALPLLRKSENARVVNIGSVSGILITPFSGAYCATKSALHSLSDALRMELAPFGIQLLTIQPGAIQSEFGNTAESTLANTLPEDSIYNPIRDFIDKRARASQNNPTPTAVFVRELVATLEKPRLPAVKRIGNGSLAFPLLKRLLPERLLDFILRRSFGLNRL